MKHTHYATALMMGAASIRALQVIFPLPILTALSDALAIAGAILAAICSRKSLRIGSPWLWAYAGVCALSIAVMRPHKAFHSWPQWGAFTAMLMAIGPLITSPKLHTLRSHMWRALIWGLRVITVVYCIGFILGETAFTQMQPHWLNFMLMHSKKMTVSALAGIVAIEAFLQTLKASRTLPTSFYALFTTVATMLCIFTGSRIASMGVILAFTLMTFVEWRNNKQNTAVIITITSITICALALFPDILLCSISTKIEIAQARGDFFFSRTSLWHDRWHEFTDYPLLGIGFHAFSHAESIWTPEGWTPQMGALEPGSSWLTILSQTGLLGFATFTCWITNWSKQPLANVKKKYVLRTSKLPSIHTSPNILWIYIAIYCLINGITEGWLTYSGSVMFMVFWLSTSLSLPKPD